MRGICVAGINTMASGQFKLLSTHPGAVSIETQKRNWVSQFNFYGLSGQEIIIFQKYVSQKLGFFNDS
jgi:hypothetical protein